MMTKQHFQAVADAIQVQPSAQTAAHTVQLPDTTVEAYELGYRQAMMRITRSLADQFQADNPRFKRETFYKACGFNTLD